jgi:methylenetetrahydrofolate reductase (NADPH)
VKIIDVLRKRATLSFEVFPPKLDKPVGPLLDIMTNLYRFEPDFISCTYGAGGTNKGRSMEICRAVKESGHEIMTHFTCIGNSREDIERYLTEYIEIGVENVLVLRGDFQAGQNTTQGDFAHADELLAYLSARFPHLCMAAAGYPEKHLDAETFEEDITHLRSKQDNGARIIMTQLCYDVAAYERYLERVRRANITLPVVVGFMPVLYRDSAVRMALSNGCSIPGELAAIMGKYGDDPVSFKNAGKDYSVRQIHRYMAAGIDGLHIYTLNKYEDVSDIVSAAGIKRVKYAETAEEFSATAH